MSARPPDARGAVRAPTLSCLRPRVTSLFVPDGTVDALGVVWTLATTSDVAELLRREHYLGPIGGGIVVAGWRDLVPVAAQVWRPPTARNLPSTGTWLELVRWCLTPDAGPNAGSRQHRYATRLLRSERPAVTTLVSYSDPGVGHTGALYRACNWRWCPTWHRLRPPPTGNGDWGDGRGQGVKDRWVYPLRRDALRADALRVDDAAAIRRWLATAPDAELALARRSLSPDLRTAVA